MITSNYINRPMEALPEEGRLVRQARSGDADAFVTLYEAYVDRVYQYVYFRVTDDELAESITPRVFIRAWQLFDRYHAYNSSFIAWLYELASDQVIEHFRSHPKTIRHTNKFLWSIEDRTFDENVKNMFDLQAMRDALQFLTDEEQQALTLKFIAGVSTSIIARMMGKPVSAIETLLLRALQTISRYMNEKELT